MAPIAIASLFAIMACLLAFHEHVLDSFMFNPIKYPQPAFFLAYSYKLNIIISPKLGFVIDADRTSDDSHKMA